MGLHFWVCGYLLRINTISYFQIYILISWNLVRSWFLTLWIKPFMKTPKQWDNWYSKLWLEKDILGTCVTLKPTVSNVLSAVGRKMRLSNYFMRVWVLCHSTSHISIGWSVLIMLYENNSDTLFTTHTWHHLKDTYWYWE